MSGLSGDGPKGILRQGWSASVGDYAIDGGWTGKGSQLVVVDAAGGVFGFEGTSGTVRWEHAEAHQGGVLAMAIHPGGELFATAGQDGRVLIWNAEDGQVSQSIELGGGWVENVAWSSDGQWIAVSVSRRVHVFGVEGQEVWRSDEHPSTVSTIVWSNGGELATACYGQVAFFDGSSGAVLQKLEWQGSLVSMVLSPDGNVVACGSQDNSVHFWRRSTGEDSQMHGYPGKPSALSFDDSGTLLATSGGEDVTVWSFDGDGPEGTSPGVLALHVKTVTALTFACRGRRLASGARDGAVVLWSLQNNGQGVPVGAALVGGEEDMPDVVSGLAWRPDDRGIAALDANGGVTYWRVMDR
jgi:WD40 repeat protein